MDKTRSVPRIDSTPCDILEQILHYCLGKQHPDVQYYDPREIPWTTAQVCRKWSSVCRSTPSLWASINYGHPGPYHRPWMDQPCSHHRRVDLLARRLEYAGNSPLRIQWDCSYSDSPAAAMRPFVDLLLTKHRSWEALSIYRMYGGDAIQLWASSQGVNPPLELSQLHCLSLVHGPTGRAEHASQFLACFRSSPMLTNVDLPSLPLNFTVNSNDDFPWARLQDLSIGSQFLSVLDILQDVKSLRLGDALRDGTGGIRTEEFDIPRVLPHLTHLVLETSMISVLRSVKAPLLDTLEFRGPRVLTNRVLSFLTSSGCALREPIISKAVPVDFTFTSFPNQQHLTHLDLRDMHLRQLFEVIRILTPRPREDTALLLNHFRRNGRAQVEARGRREASDISVFCCSPPRPLCGCRATLRVGCHSCLGDSTQAITGSSGRSCARGTRSAGDDTRRAESGLGHLLDGRVRSRRRGLAEN